MEMMSEQERYLNRVLSHDIVFTDSIIALQALIDLVKDKEEDGGKQT